jgi:hypothetical protein
VAGIQTSSFHYSAYLTAGGTAKYAYMMSVSGRVAIDFPCVVSDLSYASCIVSIKMKNMSLTHPIFKTHAAVVAQKILQLYPVFSANLPN